MPLRNRNRNTIPAYRVGGGFTGLLDTYGGAAAAYSVRRLSSTYESSLIRVREDGGDTEADIGYTANGDLDTAALLAHCGSNNGFITTWYDQSGNTKNITQASAASQPQIVNSGVVVSKGIKPSVLFNVDVLQSTAIPLTNGFTAITVGATNNNTTEQNFYDNTDSSTRMTSIGLNLGGSNRIGSRASSNGSTFFGSGEDLSSTDLILVDHYGSVLSGSESNQLRLDGNDGTQNYESRIFSDGFDLGSRGILYFLNGYISEFVYYTSNQVSNISGIESNINSYFSIYP